MNPSRIFIVRPIMTILVMAAILFFGVLSYKALPVSDLPSVQYPTIQVTASYPGANPTIMANNVTSPLEKQFTTVQGIESISSTSTTGSTTIVIQFNLDRNIDGAAADVQAAINAASQQLPQDLPYAPTYQKVNPADTPILYLALTSSTMTLADLYTYSDNIIGVPLSLIEGVSQVVTYGQPFAVRLQVDPQRLAAKNIGIDQFASSIQQHNANIPTGTIFGGRTEYTIDVDGQIDQGSQYAPLIIKYQDGNIVRVSDVGTAFNSLQNDKFYAHYLTPDSDTPSVVLAIQKQPTGNALRIIEQVKSMLPKLQKELPASVELHNIFDKSEFIIESVHDVQITVAVAFVFVVIIIFLYLGRLINTLIPVLALPMSVIGTFTVMHMLGFSIDILSLLAISLSIGFLVDDAVVVLENIVRHVELGMPPMEAALTGAKEIGFTIVSMTTCLISVFIPMLFMSGIVGRLFFEFAVTIVTAVLISGFISLSLTPMLCAILVPPHHEASKKTRMEVLSEKFNAYLVRHYEKSLKWVLRRRFLILIGGALSLVATLFIFQKLPKDFFPPDDLSFVQGFTQGRDGTSPFQLIDYLRTLNEIVKKNPAVENFLSIGPYPQDNQGLLFIRLKPYGERPPIQKVIREIYKELYMVPGTQNFLKAMPLINLQVGTTTSTGDYQYTLQSLNPKDLYKFGNELYQKMQNLHGFSQVSSDLHILQPQLQMTIQRDKASLLNINATDIENALQFAFADSNLSPINEPENQYYVIMEVQPQFYNKPSDLSQLYVRSSSNGDLTPLSEIVTITETTGPLSVNHVNTLPSVTISFNLVGVPLSSAMKTLEQTAREILPPTVTGSAQGSASIFASSFADMTTLLFITIFVIYIILGILYENFFHPITVMTTLPPAALGGLLSLLITGSTLNIYAFVGIILLLGIVLKNGIILVDFANESILKENKTPDEAILHACITRFRPILMTTLAALMGGLPIALAIGGQTAASRRSLGYVVVGGLLFSQILTLYLTPVVYTYLEALREKISKKKKIAES
jgi:HAE1 family hydrophobic/amphiphilic exporter-1